MKFNLFHKIFAAFMITILAAIVVVALTMYYTANRRFSEYVTKVEMGQLDDLAAALGSLYQETQSWEKFQVDPGLWFRFLWLYSPEVSGYPSPPPPPPNGPRPFHRNGERGFSSEGPPPPPDNRYFQEFGGKGAPRSRPFGPMPPPPPPGLTLRHT